MPDAENGARCWRSECRNGCYYPDVCSKLPVAVKDGPTCAHGWPKGNCPACAACAACDGTCGTCPYIIPPGSTTDEVAP